MKAGSTCSDGRSTLALAARPAQLPAMSASGATPLAPAAMLPATLPALAATLAIVFAVRSAALTLVFAPAASPARRTREGFGSSRSNVASLTSNPLV
jgi:hypothetical protein